MSGYLPGFGQLKGSKESFVQSNPINANYSPRLFGAPPQLSTYCDMRSMSSKNGQNGAVGDFYLQDVLRNAQIANFSVGRALFTGGFNSVVSMALQLASYAYAMKHYGIAGNNQSSIGGTSTDAERLNQIALSAYNRGLDIDGASSAGNTEEDIAAQERLNSLMNNDSTVSSVETTETVMNQVDETTEEVSETDTSTNQVTSLYDISDNLSNAGIGSLEGTGLDENANLFDISTMDEAVNFSETVNSMFGRSANFEKGVITVGSALLSSLMVNQPFYTFEADWKTYINNVKMMINTAVVMLGLQSAYVRIGNKFYPIGNNASYQGDDDVWTTYRYITPDDDSLLSTHTSIDNIKGETTQYVSFMCDPTQESESYSNEVGPSKIYSSVLSQGDELGSEIAFITNSSQSVADDAAVMLAGGTINAAQSVLGALTGSVGKFTASIASGMAKSYTGDHTIYPDIFKRHTSNENFSLHVKLKASRGDPYTYLIDVLVPLFHIFGMVLPKMSKTSSASYQFPPLVQCNVPGIWGTRLGIIESVSVTKNPDGDAVSINGYPMSINVDINVKDLMHVMVTTPMDSPALFLNNYTMFDYIAQCTGIDKYRVNSAARIVTKIALAASYVDKFFYNIGEAILSDVTSFANKRIAGSVS